MSELIIRGHSRFWLTEEPEQKVLIVKERILYEHVRDKWCFSRHVSACSV